MCARGAAANPTGTAVAAWGRQTEHRGQKRTVSRSHCCTLLGLGLSVSRLYGLGLA